MMWNLACVICYLVSQLGSSTSATTDRIGERIVLLSISSADWSVANDFCRINGMELLTINNEEENRQVAAFTDKYSSYCTWLGAKRLGTKPFLWNATGLALHYTNWAAEEPKSGDSQEQCILMAEANREWRTAECNERHFFICQEKKNPDIVVLKLHLENMEDLLMILVGVFAVCTLSVILAQIFQCRRHRTVNQQDE